MNSPIRLCLCLVLICLITTGAAGYTAGKVPVIKVFTAYPLELEDGQAASYTFVVKNATEMQLIEAGDIIKKINNPTSATLKGAAQGMTTYAIRTGDSNTFTAVLIAKNDSGDAIEEITLSFAAELPPKPASLIPAVSETKERTPLWGPQTSAPASSPSSTTSTTLPEAATVPYPPNFLKCPSGCNHCLTPDEAAGRGFTQKCSDQPCYFSPNQDKNWYCYSEPEGWCCKNTQVSQATKTQCAQMGGDWYANETQAMQACQPMCWCCRHQDGRVGKVTVNECLRVGYCYHTQAEAVHACQEMVACWCCAHGQVSQTPQSQCLQMGGHCYATQTQAINACQPATCWCCVNGRVFQGTPAQCSGVGGHCYNTQAEAMRACQVGGDSPYRQ